MNLEYVNEERSTKKDAAEKPLNECDCHPRIPKQLLPQLRICSCAVVWLRICSCAVVWHREKQTLELQDDRDEKEKRKRRMECAG